MTTPAERTMAVFKAQAFLCNLMRGNYSRVSKEVRQEARRLLKHYPMGCDLRCPDAWDLDTVQKWATEMDSRWRSPFEKDNEIVDLFKKMVAKINRATGMEMVDFSTREKVGESPLPEVILQQVADFDTKWIKGSADAKATAGIIYGQFWPQVQALIKKKRRFEEDMA